MTIKEAETFYKQDTKKYEISKNKEILIWLKQKIKNNYHSFIDIDNLQKFIDNITYWYEMKYPEREMEFCEGIIADNFKEIKSLSKEMDTKQLEYRLPHEQLCLLECNYRSYGGGIKNIYNNKNEVVGYESMLFMQINEKNYEKNKLSMKNIPSYFLITANSSNGQVDIDYNLKKYIDTDNIILDKLLILFQEKYQDKFDFSKLKECIFDHNCDKELRKKELQLVALKLLYSKETIPERGYERAKRFINEFNKNFNINLSTNEIDESFNKKCNYENKEKKSKKLERLLSIK